MSSLFTNLKSLPLIVLFLSLAYSQISFGQGHILSGIAPGNLYFMKNLTTDDKEDFSLDTCSVFYTTKEVLPEIWVRAFLENSLQGYIDKMKEKHPKISEFRLHWELRYVLAKYKDGKFISSTNNDKIKTEVVKLESLEGNNVNTVMYKLNDSEALAKVFNLHTKNFKPEPGFELHFQIGVYLKIECVYLNVLEKGKSEFCANKKNSSDIAGVSPQGYKEKEHFLSIIIK